MLYRKLLKRKILRKIFLVFYQAFENSILPRIVYPERPNPAQKGKINWNFYFYTSLWCLKRFYEGLSDIYMTGRIKWLLWKINPFAQWMFLLCLIFELIFKLNLVVSILIASIQSVLFFRNLLLNPEAHLEPSRTTAIVFLQK